MTGKEIINFNAEQNIPKDVLLALDIVRKVRKVSVSDHTLVYFEKFFSSYENQSILANFTAFTLLFFFTNYFVKRKTAIIW